MLDKDTIDFITSQNSELKADIKDYIAAHGTVIRDKIESEIDRIDEMDKLRNGRIGKCEDDIEDLQCETRVFRWAHRNPKWGIIITIILVVGIAIGAHELNLRRTLEKMTKIELKDN